MMRRKDANYTFRAIGVIHSPHKSASNTPIQPIYAEGCQGTVEVFEEYAAGLDDLEGYSHIHLLYVFDRTRGMRLRVKPFLQDMERGVFATRSPQRPNPLGMSLVSLIRRDGNILHVGELDVLDGTPLLDIKPYSFRVDSREGALSGWQEEVDDETARRLGRRGWRPTDPDDVPD